MVLLFMIEDTFSLATLGSANICYDCLLCPLAVPHVVAELLKENVALDVSYGPATSITARCIQLSLCMLMYVDSCAAQ